MKFKRILAFLLCIAMIFSLCSCSGASREDTQAQFKEFIDQLFIDEVSSDTISLHYTLKNPSAYGLGDMEPKMYSIDMSTIEQDEQEIKDTLAQLAKFKYELLTSEQQLIYKMLKSYMELNLSSSGLEYYGTYLDTISGVQSNMPINFSEYKFCVEKDVTDYLALMNQFPTFFTQVLDYEQARIDKGLGLSDKTLNEAVTQCEQFISVLGDDNIMITTFGDRLDELGIDETKRADYVAQNRKAFDEKIVPAYKDMITRLKSFLGKGKNKGGLSNFEQGKAYYEFLVAYYTGSSKTVMEMMNLLDRDYNGIYKSLLKVYESDPLAYNYFYDTGLTYSTNDPTEQLDYLINAISTDYPALNNASFKIKYVHKSLESVMSPAFYMIPPIDAYNDNVIYINRGSTDTSAQFSTLAHEGYPGHLYQTVYFNSTNPHPIRNVITFDGYVEGWATYAELDSYNMYHFDKYASGLASMGQITTKLGLNVSCRIDIGVNYQSWTVDKVASYLREKGLDGSIAQDIFDSVVNSPATYLKYYIGYLEISALRSNAQQKLGDKFNAKDFHTALLNVGPCQFQFVSEAIDAYIEQTLAEK